MRLSCVKLALIGGCFSPMWANTQLSLKALLDLKTGIASGEEMTVRESPGIITVITQEQIKSSGAQDLTEILERVPGLDLATDVQGVEGLAIRGLWANEGKVLLLVDGMEMNEHLFSSVWLGGHYPLSAIKKIEIIRGPGSALYGGYAELGVINLITVDEANEDGLQVEQKLGMNTYDKLARKSSSLSGQKHFGDWFTYFNVDYTQANQSSGPYKDIYGNETSLIPYNNALMVNLGFKYKGLEYYSIYDYFQLNRVVSFYSALNDYAKMNNHQMTHELKYTYPFLDKYKLAVTAHWKLALPWETPFQESYWAFKEDDNETPYGVRTDELYGVVELNWDPSEQLDLILGNKTTYEKAQILYDTEYLTPDDPDDRSYYPGEEDSTQTHYVNSASYLQGIYKSNWGNFVAGVRHEYNTKVSQSLVPRFAYTKAWEQFHVKLLASKAFRAPAIENFVVPGTPFPQIVPENTTVFEVEMGYAFENGFMLTANAFDMNIDKPIMYGYNSDWGGYYSNKTNWGSQGAEATLDYTQENFNLKMNYSFALPKNDDPEVYAYYGVPGHQDQSMGIASQKASAHASYRLNDFQFGANLLWRSSRYAYTHLVDAYEVNSDGEIDTIPTPTISQLSQHFILGAFVNYKPSVHPQFSVELGGANLLDQDHSSAQPYNGWKNPEPRMGRNFYLKLNYGFM